MTLAFKQKIGDWETRFPEKIWRSLNSPITAELANYMHSAFYKKAVDPFFTPKKHSIRSGSRWRPGMKIHMVINNRTKNRLQFAPVMTCKAVQTFKIKYHRPSHSETRARVFIDNIEQGEAVWVNCQLKNASYTVEQIALNDGFDDVNGFFEYFKEDFKGQIIHWTDLTY